LLLYYLYLQLIVGFAKDKESKEKHIYFNLQSLKDNSGGNLHYCRFRRFNSRNVIKDNYFNIAIKYKLSLTKNSKNTSIYT
jgi:hypothetical protein